MGVPQSMLHICENVMIDNNYTHTINFENVYDQQKFFNGKVVKSFPSYSFLRKSWSVKVNATMDQAATWVYLFFCNSPTGKFYYYFITQIEYVNDNTVELFLEMDVMQTYYFEMNLKQCFIDRQHTESDNIGEHTIEEGLECGELEIYADYGSDVEQMCIIVQASFFPEETTSKENRRDFYSGIYNNVWSGLGLFAVKTSQYIQLSGKLALFEEEGIIDGIHNMWMFPIQFVGVEDNWSNDALLFHNVTGFGFTGETLYYPYTQDQIFQGYIPNNRKLYSYPYNLLYASNNSGNSAIYRFERFNDSGAIGTPAFDYYGAISPEAPIKLVPRNYNGVLRSYEDGLTCGGFPTCAWDADAYKIWMAQNQNAQQVGLAGGAIGVVAGSVGALLNGGAGLSSAIGSGLAIQGILAQRKDMQVQPPQARGAYSASVNLASGFGTFSFQYKALTAEYARIIDSYFDMYGYKVNRHGIPNRNARRNYTYVKTIGCAVGGNLCNEDRQKIAAIFDKGITFWNDGNAVGSYGLNPCY